MAAHIRQILASLSISVSDFKKSPKTVIKAAKNDPIAVIVDNKPAFYCVPADILESLYQKLYEINEMSLQNLSVLSSQGAHNIYGQDDLFGSGEASKESPACALHGNSLIDPLSDRVSDPLDEEVAQQISLPGGIMSDLTVTEDPAGNNFFAGTECEAEPPEMQTGETTEEDHVPASECMLTDRELLKNDKEKLRKAIRTVRQDLQESSDLLRGSRKSKAKKSTTTDGNKVKQLRKKKHL